MSTLISRLSVPRHRPALQAYILLGLGVIFLLAALLLRLSPRAYPIGLLFFGLGLLAAAVVNPARLIISSFIFTLIGAAFFLGFKRVLPFDNALLIIAISLALLGIALMARRGYVQTGALTPAIFALLIGVIQYPPLGIARYLSAFILSLWFPGVALLVLVLCQSWIDG
jgi:hypothetical protein